jgi:hypothetical protein
MNCFQASRHTRMVAGYFWCKGVQRGGDSQTRAPVFTGASSTVTARP